MKYDFIPLDILDNFQELEDDGINMGYKKNWNPLNKRTHILYVNFPTIEIVKKIMILIDRIPDYHLDNINVNESTHIFMSDPSKSHTGSSYQERWKSMDPKIELLFELIENSGKVLPYKSIFPGQYIKRNINQIEFYFIKNEIS